MTTCEQKRRTIAFSKAALVIISPGKIFFSIRFRIATPASLHSSIFSADSAGKDDDPGNVIPSASAALAMVFAVYIFGVLSIAAQKITGCYPLHRRHLAQDKHVARYHDDMFLPQRSVHLANIFRTIRRQK